MDSQTGSDERGFVVTLTEAARQKLTGVLEGYGAATAGLRLQIVGRSNGEFEHVLSLVPADQVVAEDLLVDAQGIGMYIERSSEPYLNGIEIDFEDKGPNVSGLIYNNPNPLWRDDREFQIQEIFDNHINPAIASHGGWVSLLGVDGDTAFVRLGGGCQGCGMADVTLKQGIEATILERVEGIERVVDQTDHDSGENPYYRPSKK